MALLLLIIIDMAIAAAIVNGDMTPTELRMIITTTVLASVWFVADVAKGAVNQKRLPSQVP